MNRMHMGRGGCRFGGKWAAHKPACLMTTDTKAEAAGPLPHWVGGESMRRDEIPGAKRFRKMCAF